MKIEIVKHVLESMPSEFDSHQFIERFIRENEREYVEMLYAQKNSPAIFRTVHAHIAKFLADNADELHICKDTEDGNGRAESRNIKGYDSENQKWKKL